MTYLDVEDLIQKTKRQRYGRTNKDVNSFLCSNKI